MAVAEKIRIAEKSAARTVPADVVTITPKMAEDMLGKNTQNRNLSRHTVSAYARDMAAGNWKFTGEAIKFSRDGILRDGQHRLQACIEAGTPFTTLVVFDLEPETQTLMDTGRVRTVADAMSLSGQSHATRIAAACRYMHMIKSGEFIRWKVTHSEQLAMFRRHPGLEESAKMAMGSYGMSPALLTCIHYVGANLLDNAPFANEFATIFRTGNSYDGCAAQIWRERLMRMKAAKTPISHSHMYNGSIHAWNLFSASKEIKILRIPESVEFDGLDLSKI